MKLPNKIRLKKEMSSSSGGYGNYFNINNEYGIKILHDSEYSIDNIIDEYIAIKMCEESGFTPKCLGFIIVSSNKTKKLAIAMEHIEGNILEDYENDFTVNLCDVADYIKDSLELTFQECGILLRDYNLGNIIVRKGFDLNKIIKRSKEVDEDGYYLQTINYVKLERYLDNFVRIDFSPEYLDFVDQKKYKKYKKQALLQIKKLGFISYNLIYKKN